MFHNILVVTGPSLWSRNAGDTAIWLAAHLQGELVLTHMVEDDPAYQPQGPLVSAPQLRNALEATGQHLLTPAAARATHAQVTHRTVTRRDVMPEQIVRMAETDRGDLIVLGTRHLTCISA